MENQGLYAVTGRSMPMLISVPSNFMTLKISSVHPRTRRTAQEAARARKKSLDGAKKGTHA